MANIQYRKKRLIFESEEPDTDYKKLLAISQSTVYPDISFDDTTNLNIRYRYNQKNPKKSMVTLDFDTLEDYFQLFYENNDNPTYIERIIDDGRYYNRFEFDTFDTIWEDWKEGYTLGDFNPENISKLKEILTLVNPELSNFGSENYGSQIYSDISKFLYELFSRQIDNILDDRWSLINDCKLKTEKENIKKEMCDRLFDVGIFSKGYCFGEYVTTVNILISLYDINKNYEDDLTKMLSQIAIGTDPPDFYEYWYETSCDDWNNFSENFNNTISKSLDDILEKIETDEKFTGNKETYNKYVKEIYNKFQIQKWYNLPYNKEYSFRLLQVDPASDRIVLSFERPYKPSEKRSYNLEGFIDFLHNPELFENKIRKIRKILLSLYYAKRL